jgi:hypothetical protein
VLHTNTPRGPSERPLPQTYLTTTMSTPSAQPIPASTHSRARSASVYSISSLPALSNSPTVSPHSPTLPQLSPSLAGKSLTALFSGPQSPFKSGPGSFFANGGGGADGPGVVEDDDDDHDHDDFHGEFPASPPRSHTRHASITWASAPRTAELDQRIERGQGLLRRLSLGSAFASRVSHILHLVVCSFSSRACVQPSPVMLSSSPPQNVAAPQPKMPAAPRDAPLVRKPSPLRGNSLGLGGLAPAQDPIKHRGVSPMGERMLKVRGCAPPLLIWSNLVLLRDTLTASISLKTFYLLAYLLRVGYSQSFNLAYSLDSASLNHLFAARRRGYCVIIYVHCLLLCNYYLPSAVLYLLINEVLHLHWS